MKCLNFNLYCYYVNNLLESNIALEDYYVLEAFDAVMTGMCALPQLNYSLMFCNYRSRRFWKIWSLHICLHIIYHE